MRTEIEWVKESAFGNWFLSTGIWVEQVLKRALDDLEQRLADRQPAYRHILDVGCGRGKAFKHLEERFHPARIVGIDVDQRLLAEAEAQRNRCRCDVELRVETAERLTLPDASFDMVFCHQTFHHIVRQEQAILEFHRVLKPGGVLLFAESCRKFIHSLLIRALFRHPMDVQKTADDYVALIMRAGFRVAREQISMPYLWWSRRDLGLLARLGFPVPTAREETLLNLVAVRPRGEEREKASAG